MATIKISELHKLACATTMLVEQQFSKKCVTSTFSIDTNADEATTTGFTITVRTESTLTTLDATQEGTALYVHVRSDIFMRDLSKVVKEAKCLLDNQSIIISKGGTAVKRYEKNHVVKNISARALYDIMFASE